MSECSKQAVDRQSRLLWRPSGLPTLSWAVEPEQKTLSTFKMKDILNFVIFRSLSLRNYSLNNKSLSQLQVTSLKYFLTHLIQWQTGGSASRLSTPMFDPKWRPQR